MKTLIARLLLSSVLTKLGHEVHEASNGREALARGSEQQESVDQILTSGRRRLTLIDQILQVSPSEPNDFSFLHTLESGASQ